MSLIFERRKRAALWIQYVKMVSLVRSFIQAGRMGNFDLHFSTIIEMISFFHSCRHFNYAKSAHLYIPDMSQPKEKIDSEEEYQKYVNKSFFTIRRSEKYFSGVSSDMIIEQTLMRSIHSIGGLTQGRGITESVAISWLNTLTYAAYINDDLEEFCRVKMGFSKQHTDFRNSHRERDAKDLATLLNWFADHPPFPQHHSIINIATDVSGGP